MFVGCLTICLGICKFYKLFWPVRGKKPRNISAKTLHHIGYDVFFSNEYFCLLSLCCTQRLFYS